jgi:hypothetical protein
MAARALCQKALEKQAAAKHLKDVAESRLTRRLAKQG